MQKKIILLTGSTSGIGRATAFELGRNGYDLILTGRNEKKGNAIAKKIEQRYKVSTDFIKADISSINAG
jgi:short-subunit dehydrogenase